MLKASQDSPGPLADERAQIIHLDGPQEGFPSGPGVGWGWSSSLRAPGSDLHRIRFCTVDLFTSL